ncbi:hypothetical protein RhiirA4_475356 [Rhizophagus irregularis]|uniref:MULE transposase domain-containing protein n=1 Tax=Rhizophagus irregularis TaxID=588596 RepID=A0A2I1HA07_9GLOM|nr:hypothetical protein RhiirA4_475356 [Rhizophagus irregularis]
MENVGEIFHWNSLNDPLKLVLSPGYTYLIESFDELPSYQTSENFSIPQFELKTFVNVNDKERVHEWFQAFESHSKTTMRIESSNHPLEVDIKFTYNHVINSAESLSFCHVKGEVKKRFLELFRNGHSPASAIYFYEDELHISAENDQKLLEMLADRAINPDYGYIVRLFQKYRDNMLGSRNGSKMFECLAEVIENLMCRVHERIPQGVVQLVDALPLGVLITSDESEVILEKALKLLKTILSSYSFYGRGSTVFFTDDSNAERNALNLCWPQAIRLLYNKYYQKLKQEFYYSYPQLQKHLDLLWERRQFWALSFCSVLPIRGNNTNNYIERSFRILKDIIFARIQAFNSVQVFHFVTENMDRFYKLRLLRIVHKHPGHTIAKRFFCPGWEIVDESLIQQTTIKNKYLVPSTRESGASCKHQGAVSVKFHIANFNFLPSLTPNDHMVYSYIAIGFIAENSSFYASLQAGFPSQIQIQLQVEKHNEIDEGLMISSTTEWRELNENNEDEIDKSALVIFLEEIKVDYENYGPQFRTAFDKFAKRYHASKSQSIPQLCSFLYDINRNVDPTRVKSGSMIHVQVESVKRRKSEGSNGTRRKLSAIVEGEKENSDPQTIQSRKKRKGKKEHNLSKNILRNQLN